MAIKIGITGGIGSGKSVVSRLLEVMGIPVYISDIESKKLTSADLTIRQELCALLGDELYAGNELNKTLLGSFLFAHADHARIINGIIHPHVRNHFRSWVTQNSLSAIVGMESAILIESGFSSEVDVVVMVYAPIDVRITRSMKRDKTSREQIMKRIDSQMSDEEKLLKADFTIINDDEKSLIPQVLELISFLSKNNHYLCRAKK